MRILLAVHQFLPEFRAGTEILTLRTGQELQRRGHRIWVLSGSDEAAPLPRLDRFEQEGLAVIRIHAPAPPSVLGGGLGQTYRREDLRPLFAGILDEVRPELVHVFHLRRLTLALVDLARERGVPVVASLTDYWFACLTGQLQFPADLPCPGPDPTSANCLRHAAGKTHPAFLRLPGFLWPLLASPRFPWGRRGLGASIHQLRERPALMREGFGAFERVLVPSRLMAETFTGLGFPSGRLRICPYGIAGPGPGPHPAREEWPGPRARPLRVGFIGTLIEAKGAHVLLEAVGRLGADPPLRLQVYGSPTEHPSYARQLQRQAAALPVVSFAGVFPPERIYGVLMALDLLVIPSLWRENSPLILLQALASGLPVLASDVAGMAEVLEPGSNGELFAAGDAEALSRWLAHFLARPADLARLRDRGGSPRTMEEYTDQLEAEYGAVLQACRTRP